MITVSSLEIACRRFTSLLDFVDKEVLTCYQLPNERSCCLLSAISDIEFGGDIDSNDLFVLHEIIFLNY